MMIHFRKILLGLLILPLCWAAVLPAEVWGALPFFVTAPSVVLLEPGSRKIVYSKAPHRRQPPASTAKLLTALVVLDELALDRVVTVSARVTAIEPTKLYLRAGDQLTVRDLMKGLLIKSANDAARALAIAVSGSEIRFAELMNKKARALGARNTRFRNASGLPAEGQYSTAYDMALIMNAAMKSPVISSILKHREAVIRTAAGRRFYLKNHNKMLWRRTGVIGKTGYTRRARHCFVGTISKASGTVIVSILGSRKLWPDLEAICVHRLGRPKTSSAVSFGARGEQVKQFQTALKRAGFFEGRATGYFGEKTNRAVRRFQKTKGIPTTGAIGPLTRKALEPYR